MLSGIKTQKSFIDQLGERKMKIKELVNEVSIVDLVKAIKKDPTIPNLPQNATFMQRAQTLANNKKVDNLVDLVQKALETNAPCLTVEQVQRMGALDPVAVQIDPGPWLSLSESGDGPKIAEIIQQLKVYISQLLTYTSHSLTHSRTT